MQVDKYSCPCLLFKRVTNSHVSRRPPAANRATLNISLADRKYLVHVSHRNKLKVLNEMYKFVYVPLLCL